MPRHYSHELHIFFIQMYATKEYIMLLYSHIMYYSAMELTYICEKFGF